jgi:hypothetical protein
MENWQNLAKNSEDPEKIEEAVDRLVGVHNDDENSHVEVGQSLQSHKASKVIDHIARSIVGDKLNSIDDILTKRAICVVTGIQTDGSNKIITYTATPDLDENSALKFAYFLTGTKANTEVKIISDGVYTITVLAADVVGVLADDEFFITAMKFGTDQANWQIIQNDNLAYNALIAYNETTDDYIEYTIECDRVEIYGLRSYDGGKFNVYIDGEADAIVDSYSAEQAGLVSLYEKQFETTATRTIKIEIRDDKNAASDGYACRINAFDINGVIDYSSMRILKLYHHWLDTVDSSGYATFAITPPTGYQIISNAGHLMNVAGQPIDKAAKLEYFPYNNTWKVVIEGAGNGTEVELETWWLIVKLDDLYEVRSA